MKTLLLLALGAAGIFVIMEATKPKAQLPQGGTGGAGSGANAPIGSAAWIQYQIAMATQYGRNFDPNNSATWFQ